MSNGSRLGSVPLYTHVDRIARGLALRGIGPNDAIPPEELFALDQWHYHGTDAIGDAARFLGLGPMSRVLDVGRASAVRPGSSPTRRDATSLPSSCSPSCTGSAST